MASGAPPPAVCVVWDIENMRIPKGYSVYETCRRLRERALQEGRIISFRAYCSTEFERGARSTEVRSQLQASGVTIVDTPHNGSKEVCDKAIIVDLFTFVLDNPAPATIILVSGDADFAYACSTLRNRRFRVVIICPEERLVNQALRESCDELCADWRTAILQMPPAPPRRDAPMSRKNSSEGLKRQHYGNGRAQVPSLPTLPPKPVTSSALTNSSRIYKQPAQHLALPLGAPLPSSSRIDRRVASTSQVRVIDDPVPDYSRRLQTAVVERPCERASASNAVVRRTRSLQDATSRAEDSPATKKRKYASKSRLSDTQARPERAGPSFSTKKKKRVFDPIDTIELSSSSADESEDSAEVTPGVDQAGDVEDDDDQDEGEAVPPSPPSPPPRRSFKKSGKAATMKQSSPSSPMDMSVSDDEDEVWHLLRGK